MKDSSWSKVVLAIILAPIAGVVGYNLGMDAGAIDAEAKTTIETPRTPAVRAKVALDCNRPQGHHRWVGEVIVPQEGTVMRVSNGDVHEDIDIEGWLCVIDAEPAR